MAGASAGGFSGAGGRCGYVALALVRTIGDRAFGDALAWASVLALDSNVVDLTMSTVSASIGLHLSVRTLLASGARAGLVGGGASFAIAALSLAMIVLASRHAPAASALVGGAALALSAWAHRLVGSRSNEDRALRVRFEHGAPLALAEATRVLDSPEADGALDDAALHTSSIPPSESSSPCARAPCPTAPAAGG